MTDLTAYELARLRLRAFAMLDDWGTSKGSKHETWSLETRREKADELVEWAIAALCPTPQDDFSAQNDPFAATDEVDAAPAASQGRRG